MKRIGFDHIDPTTKPETSFHAPPLPQLVQGWRFFLFSSECRALTRWTGPQNVKHSLNDEGFQLRVSIAFLEQNIYSLSQLMAELKT
jgi:hypothetical protein